MGFRTLADRRPRVFISQPMRGHSEEEILAVREQALEAAKGILGVPEVIEIPSYIPSFEDDNPVSSLGKSIDMMADADLVIFCEGWGAVRRCRIEYAVATEYDLNIREF